MNKEHLFIFRLIHRIFIVVFSLSLFGCSSFTAGNFFSHYSAQNEEMHQSLVRGDYSDAQSSLDADGAGPILSNLEKGRLALLNKETDESQRFFEQGDNALKEQQQKAVISLSEEAGSLAALSVNDNLTSYVPADYEVGFLHLYMALNYLDKNNFNDALVELRRANIVQKKAKDIREESLKNEQETLSENGVSPSIGSVLANYPGSSNTLSAIQNGYLFFLSGLIYEATRNVNDAYIDYNRALAVAPDNQVVIDAVIRCAEQLDMKDDLVLLRKKYKNRFTHIKNSHKARVIIIREQGVVKAMKSWKQSLPIIDSRSHSVIYSLALPYYDNLGNDHNSGYPVTLNSKVIDENVITDVNHMAAYALRERIVSTIVRQVMRLVIKDQVRRELAKDNELASIMVSVWNTFTEQPDTRSWLSLPGMVTTAEKMVSPGEQHIQIGTRSYDFNVQEGRTVLVWVSQQGSGTVIWHKKLGRL
ncbi:COG3014 family protein [Vibrio salinus]|uniref:COG3014 family protein n=1 Tax=Vibrio salinus TaxID=2899784 RepID=UPI001E64E6E1|nr:hypothetical protein [Vibrio salinus]MCE0492868.1 hypothetical protein [Vibrio salinus]